MGITSTSNGGGITTVTVDYPPVNALPSAAWFELAETILAAGRDRDTHVVILRAEGRGFNAGVDIKEMQATEGFDALIGANRGCAAAFSAVYDCEVPVVVAVNGFCVGGGVGLVGNADVIVASDDAVFGLPEVDRGALGDTVIGEGTKIDNLVQIGHNCRIGRYCLIAGQSGLSGSTVLEDGVLFGGGAGTSGHLTIGAGSIVRGRAAVATDLPAGSDVAGAPAQNLRDFWREVATRRRLSKREQR